MEKEKESIFDRIDKIILNSKSLNIIIAITMSIFMIVLMIAYVTESAKLNAENERYQYMLQKIEENELNVIYSNVSPNSGTIDTSKEMEEPMFVNAKQAVAFAFDKFSQYKSFETKSEGMSYTSVLGQNVEVKTQGKTARYRDGYQFDTSYRIETKTNFGQSGATEIVYKDGVKYQRDGKNPRVENSKCVADFSGDFYRVNSSLKEPPSHLVNEETIIQSRSFSYVRDKNNKILYYKATVVLDSYTSTRTHGLNIQEQGGTSFPTFDKIELSCIIDRDGYIVSYSYDETMTVAKHIVVDISVSIHSTTTTVILSHDETPTIPMPM